MLCTKIKPDMTITMTSKETGLLRRLMCMLYDAMLLIAIFFFATLPLVVVLGGEIDSTNLFYGLYLLLISLLYFVWFWTHGGQTLGMKSWKVRVYSSAGGQLSSRQALLRFLCSLLSLSLAGMGFFWALVDREKQTLHDRCSGTRLRHDCKQPKQDQS
jgi:uncharacterized RDD family membrane protein YckC